VAGIPVYTTALQSDWIDYNGHLRDAYYGLIVSLASDALMDQIGLDASYRERTAGTLYTVEMHIHFLREVKAHDTVNVQLRILGVDHKRIHAAFELLRNEEPAPAAVAEVMLLHVQQGRDGVSVVPFPAAVSSTLAQLAAKSATFTPAGPQSRRMELRPHSRPS
jgi:acyl-CoA thioester hydrolase